MIDDDAIRDAVVYRTAHGQCVACGADWPHVSFRQAHCPMLLATVTAPSGDVFHYPWCGGQGCADWLCAQELLGRLPHQSTTHPRARWVEQPSWTPGVPGWGLQQGEHLWATAQPYLGAWRAFLRTGAGIGPALPLARAQAWAEAEVVRAERERARRKPQDGTWQTGEHRLRNGQLVVNEGMPRCTSLDPHAPGTRCTRCAGHQGSHEALGPHGAAILQWFEDPAESSR